ncbi:Like-Sm ribonucleoprotein (LSM) domain, eukaryotic/archaea-type [Penicillium camemberti]|uniref:Like-Sm ribonucleoprotein (LSM) domain, eukaryotic/archaea-type n=1 Tax=Penicillium camemberti (strain FM 013) TaxID=1429867 RepID=A0A0G4PWQ2_PENC3|nr:Like-Sm ribonucleoprotein (LSM) domain, eukaryotic/archaea-type [Penicillium camemberti]
MDHDQSVQYLEGLLGCTLRIHTTDTRMFVGLFKCTDADRNIILANSFEYRMPTTSAVQAAADEKQSWGEGSEAKSTTVKVNMTHRLIGLIVIPGRHITKIELDSTAPQYQAAWHLLHPPTRYAAGEARFLPCAHHYPGPCFSARTRVRRGAAKRRLACSGIRCSINVAPGSQQLHRSVAASKVA